MYFTRPVKKARMPEEIGDEIDPAGVETPNEIVTRAEPEGARRFADIAGPRKDAASTLADIRPSSFEDKLAIQRRNDAEPQFSTPA
ncbi:MAG: hypothetical protein KGJ06_06090, partial [Pseudomonadota bacterium]|nr:hypothetical protein [Pseudomonadota bacterium]